MFLKCLGNFSCLSKCSFHIGALFFAKKNYYEVLGVSEDANQSQIKSAYYKLSLIYHPDTNKESDETSKKFRDITEAYETLGNFDRRKLYDRGLTVPKGQSQWKPRKTQIFRTNVGPTKSVDESIYDFDAWTRAHYGETFQRRKNSKVRHENKTKFRENLAQQYHVENAVFLIMFSLFTLLLIFSKFDVDMDKTTNDKLANNRNKNERDRK